MNDRRSGKNKSHSKISVYLDHHATTPLDPRVLRAMLPFLKEEFGNPSSENHIYGERARKAVEQAREEIGRVIGGNDSGEIIFTSGATEANNLAIRGVAQIYREKGNHIITSAIEHKSVLETCRHLESTGFRVSYLGVDSEGRVRLDELESAITEKTILITIMHANNEIGTIQPVAEIGRIARKRNVFFHTDAAQSAGKIPFDVEGMNIGLATLSAHKVYGPKGIGALYLRRKNPRVRISPLLFGGGQERGIRPGTLNAAGIVGFGEALKIAASGREKEKRLLSLRERLRNKILKELDHVYVNGSLKERLPGNLNMSFLYVEGGALLAELGRELAVSSGSACAQGSSAPSYVLRALGLDENRVHTSVRFGLGRFNTGKEIDFAAERVIEAVKRLRGMSLLYQTVTGKARKKSSDGSKVCSVS